MGDKSCEECSGHRWHIDGEDEQPRRGGVVQRGGDAAEWAAVGPFVGVDGCVPGENGGAFSGDEKGGWLCGGKGGELMLPEWASTKKEPGFVLAHPCRFSSGN